MMHENVAVIGAAGHVGLGLTLSIADAGHQVFGIDINQAAIDVVRRGEVPFIEEGAAIMLGRVLANGRLTMTSDLAAAADCRVIIVILGTPIDENLNPVVAPLHNLFRSLRPHLRKARKHRALGIWSSPRAMGSRNQSKCGRTVGAVRVCARRFHHWRRLAAKAARDSL